MRIEIAKHGRMTESGSSLLRLIQNQDMPLLDLLVRESVQNSLDARRSDESSKVFVDITVGKFDAPALNEHFEAIQKPLNTRFPAANGQYGFIQVRDSNTKGLTGPVRYEDVRNNDFGNCLKLVYEICKPQQDEGAGGSWGLGKTIYFRIGIGLVLYYSRIWQDGKYRSRLAACLVENENKPEALIPHYGGVRRGIAWWGEHADEEGSSTVPIEDEEEIFRILSVFNIAPYRNNETGTTIIIPYINERALLDEVYATNEDGDHKPYWSNSLSEYFDVALQRWYAPRINNSQYNGAYLVPSINGVRMKVSNMLPLFRTVREMYILACGGEISEESILSNKEITVNTESVDLRGVFEKGQSAGKFVYAKLTKKQLLMTPPDNHKSPYQQISNCVAHMEGGNVPVIMYTRRPGMIVGYDYDGSWTHTMPRTSEDEYVIGLFVVNSANTVKALKAAETGLCMSLEEYIRQGEKADHASWTDRNIGGNNPRIVQNIKNGIIRKIRTKYTERVLDSSEKKNVGLSHALANILLPSADFGKVASTPDHNGGDSDTPKKPKNKKRSTFSLIGSPEYNAGSIGIRFELFMCKNDCDIRMLLVTDFKKYDADLWESEKEIGQAFPLTLISFSVDETQLAGSEEVVKRSVVASPDCITSSDETVQVKLSLSKKYGVLSQAGIHTACKQVYIRGKIEFASDDPGIKTVFDLKEA